MNQLIVVIAFAVISAGLSPSANAAGEQGYVLAPSVWVNPSIKVCWENPSPDDMTQRLWVSDQISKTWEAHSLLRFDGWQKCPDQYFHGIRILIKDHAEHGPSVQALGRFVAGKKNGMILNFTFENWGSICQANVEKCIRTIAVHEFGHAIGFSHEQNRPDTPPWCNREQGTDGNVMVQTWDANSVMNYCAPLYGNDGNLSAGDIATVQTFYDARFTSAKKWTNGFGRTSGNWVVNKHPRMLGDVNGDGKDDIVGFADAGVFVSLSNGTSFSKPMKWVNGFGRTSGRWAVEHHPRTLADVNGDGKLDIVGFADAGVFVSLSRGTSFSPPKAWVNGYGRIAGKWSTAFHPRMVGDVNGDGKDDIVGFADAAVFVSLSDGTKFSPPAAWVGGYGRTSGGWDVRKHPRMLADVNGDGKLDVVGFADDAVYVSLSDGKKFSPPKDWVIGFGQSSGWSVGRHLRVMSDVNGDRKLDVVGFGEDGVYVAISKGNKFAVPAKWIEAFGQNAGKWSNALHPRLLADVNGDGMSDVVGFGDSGVFVARNLASVTPRFSYPVAWIENFGRTAGKWSAKLHPRMAADVNGDGRADIVGFGDAGVYVSVAP